MKRDYKIDVYDSILTISDSYNEIKMSKEWENIACCLIGKKSEKFNVVIYLPKPCLRTACHESVHAAYSLLDRLSVNIDAKNQEPLAWLTDYIFSCCQRFITEQEKQQ